MITIQNKSLKKEYIKSKLILKAWEDDFISKNGRNPAKADIKLSPLYVRESYNKYYKIKIMLLSTQILEKENETNEDILLQTVKKNDENKTPKEIISEIHEEEQKKCENSNIFSCNSIKKINQKIWGTELNKSNNNNLNFKEEKKIIFNPNFSKTLFEGTSFNKRNPRKPLFPKNKTIKDSTIHFNDSSHEAENKNAIHKEFDLQLEENQNICKSPKEKDTLKSLKDHAVLNAVNYNMTNKNFTVNQVSLVQQITSGSKELLKKMQNVQENWIKNFQNKKENMEETIPATSNFLNLKSDTDVFKNINKKHCENELYDEDIIRSSDNELDENVKHNCFLSKHKRKLETSSDVGDENYFSFTELHDHKKVKLTHDFLKDSKEVITKKSLIKKKNLNDNYVKLNLVKKTYVRGKRKFNFSRYKKQKNKKEKKKLENCTENESRCIDINDIDHFEMPIAKKLPKQLFQFEKERDVCHYNDPLTAESQILLTETIEKNISLQIGKVMAEEPIKENCANENFPPFYNSNDLNSATSTRSKIFEALKLFGHSDFLPGQEKTIMRILSGQSTLLISSTGGGKSLCYQLPAYLYSKRSKSIALIISPLISLMEDQVSSSSFFKAGYLYSDQSQKQYEAVLEKAKAGKLFAILISPEMVASGDSLYVFNKVFKQLPPISFACIDEIHCMSHWSHNFRPSYLIINRVLREKFGIKTVLGLTATATMSTIENIVNEVGISKADGIIKTGFLPDNLNLSISRDEKKDEVLIDLLKSSKFKDFQSILIYCKRRDECDRLASLIRTVFQNDNIFYANNKEFIKESFVESYHAGMTIAKRKFIQKAFLKGNIRIVVATVAFGMGINKSNIQSVIHYNIPKDLENYVQEIGRAGRNGSPAYCHLFLDTSGEELCQLSSHIHSISIDRYIIRKLLEKVFRNCMCKKENKQCKGHEIAFSCDETVFSLDIPHIYIQTLLCYLELHEKNFIKLLSPAFLKCKIKSYKGINALNDAIKICPPLAHAYLSMTESDKKRNVWELDVIKIANEINCKSEIVKSRLKSLEWQLNDKSQRIKTGISVEFFNLGFRIKSRGDLELSELDEALDYLMQKVENQKLKSLNHLDIIFSIFENFASDSCKETLDNYDFNKSDKLKKAIKFYFETEELLQNIPLLKFKMEDFDEKAVAADIKAFLSVYSDNSFNARSIARIFHGISSPNYPALFWCKNRFWKKHKNKDFNKIIELAKYEILRFKF